MKSTIFQCFLSVILLSCVCCCNAEYESFNVTSRINSYNSKNAKSHDRKVRIVYFYPADTKPCADHKQRIHDIMIDIQQFYRDGMKANGFGDMTFDLEFDTGGKVVVHEVQGSKDRDQYTQQSAQQILSEIDSALRSKGINVQRETVLIISALLKEDDNVISGHKNCPYHGGGNPMAGKAFVSDTSFHAMANLKVKEPMIRAERGRTTLGTYASHQIGGYAHELGHAFGLPHDAGSGFENRKGVGHTLMGSRGNLSYRQELRGDGPGSYLSAASAMRLASHPLFTKSTPKQNARPTVSLNKFDITKVDSVVTIDGVVSATPGAYGVVAYVDKSESFVNPRRKDSDYDALTYTSAVDKEGGFELEVKDVGVGRYQLRLTFCLFDGSTQTMKYELAAGDDSAVKWQNVAADWRLQKCAEVMIDGRTIQAQAMATVIKKDYAGNQLVVQKANHLIGLLDVPDRFPEPSEMDVDEVSLSQLAWVNASVGWGKPGRDRVPEMKGPVSGGEIFLAISGNEYNRYGLFAHAPSSIEYDLAGKWNKFTAKAGVQNGRRGTVEFVVIGDGKELARSKVISQGQKHEFDVNIEGVKKLELKSLNGGDGNTGDWSIWLMPIVAR